MLTITCIIPSLCTKESLPLLAKCIDSLYISALGTLSLRLELILVTNGTGVLPDKVKTKIQKYIRTGSNYSFAEMVNTGVSIFLKKNKKSKYVFLLNDDAWVDKSFFRQLNRILKNTNTDFVIPIIYKSNSFEIDSYGMEYLASGYPKSSQLQTIKTCLATGTALVVSRRIVEKSVQTYGYFLNEFLSSYLEDVEISIRAHALGAVFTKSNDLVVYHIGSFTNKKNSKYVTFQTFRNIIWVLLIAWPLKSLIIHAPAILYVQFRFFLRSFIRFGPLLYFQILSETAKNIKKILKLRKKTLKRYPRNFDFETILSERYF